MEVDPAARSWPLCGMLHDGNVFVRCGAAGCPAEDVVVPMALHCVRCTWHMILRGVWCMTVTAKRAVFAISCMPRVACLHAICRTFATGFRCGGLAWFARAHHVASFLLGRCCVYGFLLGFSVRVYDR